MRIRFINRSTYIDFRIIDNLVMIGGERIINGSFYQDA
jgi:hypothetical protein